MFRLYNWTVSPGGIISSGAGTNTIVVTWMQAGAGIVSVSYATATLPGTLEVQVLLTHIPTISVSPGANPVCSGASVTISASIANGGISPVFQWKVNGIQTGTNSPFFTMVPLNGDQVLCELLSNEPCVSSNPVTSNTVVMTVGPSQLVSVSVTTAANPVCQGTSVSFSAIAVNGGIAPVFSWKVNGIQTGSNASSFAYIPVNGDVVTCQVTSTISCATGNPAVSLPITMTVNPVSPVSVIVQASSNPICQGLPVSFTANPVNGGNSPVFQWTVNGFPMGSNGALFTYIPANGDAVLCKLFSSEQCRSVYPAISNTIFMTVSPNLPVNVAVSSSANPVCIGSVVTLTATPYNGGTNPFFSWRVNGSVTGTNSSIYSYVPGNGDQIACSMTSNAGCVPVAPVVSNTITMSVSQQLPVAVTIVPSMNPVCQNVQVIFTASSANSGSFPIYQWKVNGISQGSSNPVFTDIPQNGDLVTCDLTSSVSCVTGNPATSNTVLMSVIPSLGMPVSVTVTSSSNPSCTGQAVTYTAAVVNGGSSPVYAWTVNGLNVGNNSQTFSYTPSAGDFIRCTVTSNLACATSNPAVSNVIAMAVNPIQPVSVSIISSANPTCLGTSVNYTANPVNPGSLPVYQWKVNGLNAGTNQNTFVYSPVNGTVVTCELTSNIGCTSGNPAISNAITMGVQPSLPVNVSISTLTNPSCSGSQVSFHATISNGGTAPAYQWKLNGINTGSNNATLMFTPANGDVITCKLTSNALCYAGNKIVTSNPITMVVGPELVPAVSVSASSNPFCEGNPVTFIATPINGGTLPVYQWKVNCQPAGTSSATFIYSPSEGDFIACQMTSNLSCAVMNPGKSNGVTMVRDSGTPAGISISASANPVCQGTNVSFNATVVNGGTLPVYQWKVNGNNTGVNSPVFAYPPVNGDIVACQLTSNASCVSGNPMVSAFVTMSVSASLPASIGISTPTNPFCPGTAVHFLAKPINGGNAPVYQWKRNGVASGSNSSSFTCYPQSGMWFPATCYRMPAALPEQTR